MGGSGSGSGSSSGWGLRESACLLFIYRSVCVVFTLSPCRLEAEVCLPIEMLDKVSIDPHDDDVDVCAQIDR